MKKIGLAGIVVVFVLTLMMSVSYAEPAKGKKMMKMSQSAVTLKMDMRKLWEEHNTWTSIYIMSAVAGLDDSGKIAERLLKNQTDIGNAIRPIYGDAAGDKLAALLKDHILQAAELVGAAKAGDNAKATEVEKKWYANADEIVALLNGANPNWPKDALKALFYAHLAMVKQEAVSRLSKDGAGYITARDNGNEHILKIADALSSGIIKQFPKKFEK